MEFVVAQLLNGLVYGMLLFLMAAGLSLIFGLMNVVSLAHGSFFMLGAFFGLSIYQFTGSFWLALVLAPVPVAAIGIVMELVFMRPLYRRGHMDQVLLTFGFTFVFFDLVQAVWGRVIVRLPASMASTVAVSTLVSALMVLACARATHGVASVAAPAPIIARAERRLMPVLRVLVIFLSLVGVSFPKIPSEISCPRAWENFRAQGVTSSQR